jgi:hypothetical protein
MHEEIFCYRLEFEIEGSDGSAENEKALALGIKLDYTRHSATL